MTPRLVFRGNLANPEKPMVFKLSPCVVSFPGGIRAHNWFMAGAMPRLRGSHGAVPVPQRLETLPGWRE